MSLKRNDNVLDYDIKKDTFTHLIFAFHGRNKQNGMVCDPKGKLEIDRKKSSGESVKMCDRIDLQYFIDRTNTSFNQNYENGLIIVPIGSIYSDPDCYLRVSLNQYINHDSAVCWSNMYENWSKKGAGDIDNYINDNIPKLTLYGARMKDVKDFMIIYDKTDELELNEGKVHSVSAVYPIDKNTGEMNEIDFTDYVQIEVDKSEYTLPVHMLAQLQDVVNDRSDDNRMNGTVIDLHVNDKSTPVDLKLDLQIENSTVANDTYLVIVRHKFDWVQMQKAVVDFAEDEARRVRKLELDDADTAEALKEANVISDSFESEEIADEARAKL